MKARVRPFFVALASWAALVSACVDEQQSEFDHRAFDYEPGDDESGNGVGSGSGTGAGDESSGGSSSGNAEGWMQDSDAGFAFLDPGCILTYPDAMSCDGEATPGFVDFCFYQPGDNKLEAAVRIGERTVSPNACVPSGSHTGIAKADCRDVCKDPNATCEYAFTYGCGVGPDPDGDVFGEGAYAAYCDCPGDAGGDGGEDEPDDNGKDV